VSEPTAYEQYLLELVNRARLDPAAEAAREGIPLDQGLDPGQITTAAKQPLAFNPQLMDAASAHSSWMLANDTFSHTGADGSSPGDRMAAAGYKFTGNWSWGENIAWYGTTGTPDVQSFVTTDYDNLFHSAEHRLNTLNDGFREIGIGIVSGPFTASGQSYNSVMTTEDFAQSATQPFLTGVAFNDKNGDAFYAPGEGWGGVQVSALSSHGTTATTTTMSAGGYQEQLAADHYTVTFSGGPLLNPLSASLDIGSSNVELDLLGQNSLSCSSSVTLGNNVTELHLLGCGNLTAIGNTLNDKIFAGSGTDVLDGGGGSDTFMVGTGADTMTGNGSTGAHQIFVFSSGTDHDDVITDFHTGQDVLDLRTLMTAIGYHGTNPLADHVLQLSQTAAGDTNLMIDPSGTSGGAHILVTLQHVSASALKPGTDLLWH
jgi:serralysin